MTPFPEYNYTDKILWSATGTFSALLFFSGIVVFVLQIRQKRRAESWLAVLMLLLSYGLFQCISTFITGMERDPIVTSIVMWVADLPKWIVFSLCAVLASGEVLLFSGSVTRRKWQITPMSVKEATDSFPAGLLCYARDGRIFLINHTMENFGKTLTGSMPTDGRAFSEMLSKKAFLPGCSVIEEGETSVFLLSDGTAWIISENTIPYEKLCIQAMMVSNITELYRKTLELRKLQEKIEALNRRLTKTNNEIVALTAEQELLKAKIKIHDEMGNNLLSIKRFILNGGTEHEKTELIKRLRENIDYIKGENDAVRDEYELMIDTARQLDVNVVISGLLPQTEPCKRVIATAIHECLTNTLRHAHGNELRISIEKRENQIVALFTNNGEQPVEEIREKGGLILLRTLTEQAGGHMKVRSFPFFSITLYLPEGE